jgi:pescadillo
MARIKKRSQEGAAKTYITRTQAVKLLQLSLADFRRLCILKGVYPREPRSKKRANKGSTANTTFYYAKDIRFLLHEPVLQTFRQQKAFAKKLTRAIGKEDYTKAKDLQENRPHYSLDHIVKERFRVFHSDKC